MTRMSALEPSSGCVVTSGEMAIATVVAAKMTMGASGRTTLEWRAWSRSFESSFRRSRKGWTIGAPTRPSARALIFAMKPMSNGPSRATSTTCSNVARTENAFETAAITRAPPVSRAGQ